MNPSLTALYALQQVDSALALAQRQYQALDPGRAEQAALETARVMYERMNRTFHETQGDLRDSELELEAVEQKKKEYEKKLYGGKVTSPKELMDMQKEIEALGHQRGRLDERILKLMEQIETRRAEEADAKSKLQVAEAAFATKQAQHKAASKALADQIRLLTTRREEAAKPIPPPLLKRYESIRAGKGGVGIAQIEDGRCGACHTNLPSNLLRRLQETDSIETCENCGRLLCFPA